MGRSAMKRLPAWMEEQMHRALSVDQLCGADKLSQIGWDGGEAYKRKKERRG